MSASPAAPAIAQRSPGTPCGISVWNVSEPHAPFRGSATRLIDREAECRLLDQLLAAVRDGESRALILHGEAGVGKTALLEYLSERASDAGCQVVSAAGVQSEMELASHEYLMIQVWDALPAAPTPKPHAVDSETGRGLEIVSLLADRWGYYHPPDGGKVVWAALVTGAPPGASQGAGA